MKTTMIRITAGIVVTLAIGICGCSPAEQKPASQATGTQAADKPAQSESPMAKAPAAETPKEPAKTETPADAAKPAADAAKPEAEGAMPVADALTRGFKVTGMHCSGCENMIRTKLKSMEGVKSASASHKKERVVVVLDGTKEVTDAALMEAIQSAGGDYKAEPLPKE